MLHHIKKLFGIKPKAAEAQPEVPYKVEVAPAPVAVGEPPATVVVEGAVEIPAKPVKAKKAPAVKKPRAPKKPKAD